jgi:hypothetical protein
MVEVKFHGDKWPIDQQKSNKKQESTNWRDFKIGDKVDYLDEKLWKIARVSQIDKK